MWDDIERIIIENKHLTPCELAEVIKRHLPDDAKLVSIYINYSVSIAGVGILRNDKEEHRQFKIEGL